MDSPKLNTRCSLVYVLVVMLCGLSTPSLAGGESAYDLLYTGVYQVRVPDPSDQLNCRLLPELSSEIVRTYPQGLLVRTVSLQSDGRSWFKTAEGCYVRASSAYLIWKGQGEDPSTMCDPRKEGC